jgi:hypothetical protein
MERRGRSLEPSKRLSGKRSATGSFLINKQGRKQEAWCLSRAANGEVILWEVLSLMGRGRGHREGCGEVKGDV